MASDPTTVTLALSSASCDSDDDKSSSKAEQAEADGGSAEAATVNLDLHVWDLVADDTPLPDSKVCVFPELTECETSDEEGHVTLRLPANSETGFLIDATASDHTRLLVLHRTSTDDLVDDYSLASFETAREYAGRIGFELDADKALIVAQTYHSEDDWTGVEGVTVKLTPTAGAGPFYFGEDGPDEALDATTVAGGSAYFGEVPPGEYTLTFSGKDCEITEYGWKAKGQGAARVTALANTRTTIAAQCD